MITAQQMNQLGLPNHAKVMPLAMKIVNSAVAQGHDQETILNNLRRLASNPQALINDEILGTLAQAMWEVFPKGAIFQERPQPAPWLKWGDINLEDSALKQMEAACRLPNVVRGALMPDAHTGYGLPIGGVLAVRAAVIPFAVGMDIACRMRLTVLDLPLSHLEERQEALINALETETSFGIGAEFTAKKRREHQVMEEDWNITKVTAANREKAAKQLGSSGSGNHFVEFGELVVSEPALGLPSGRYLALLSHSGSRGSGEAVAHYYSKLAKDLRPQLPDELKNLAWLDLASEPGQEYWAAMKLMGRYAAANHELIHRHVLKSVGAQALTFVENHHNFAWEEEHGGEKVIVHRKGATPAGAGVLGVVPGSMGAPGFVVRGLGEAGSLRSCSHGAGRLMSRTQAMKTFNRREILDYLKERDIRLISGGLDEAPMAYKDIHEVMKAQSDLVETLACFKPRLVKMAPDEKRRRRK